VFFLFLLQFLSETILITRRTEEDMMINACWSLREVHVVF